MTPDRDRMRTLLEQLERIDRPSASEGERRAAEWLVERFAELGAEARIEAEPAHGTTSSASLGPRMPSAPSS